MPIGQSLPTPPIQPPHPAEEGKGTATLPPVGPGTAGIRPSPPGASAPPRAELFQTMPLPRGSISVPSAAIGLQNKVLKGGIVEIQGAGDPGSGMVVHSQSNPDGSMTYYALTAGHVPYSSSGRVEPGWVFNDPTAPDKKGSVPPHVITKDGIYPVDRVSSKPSGGQPDLALVSFTVPAGGPRLPVAAISPDGRRDLLTTSATLVAGAPAGTFGPSCDGTEKDPQGLCDTVAATGLGITSRQELGAEGAQVEIMGNNVGVYTASTNGPASNLHPKGIEGVAASVLGYHSTFPTEPGTSGSAYVVDGRVAGVHVAISPNLTVGGPDKGATIFVEPVSSDVVNAHIEAMRNTPRYDNPSAPDVLSRYYKLYPR